MIDSRRSWARSLAVAGCAATRTTSSVSSTAGTTQWGPNDWRRGTSTRTTTVSTRYADTASATGQRASNRGRSATGSLPASLSATTRRYLCSPAARVIALPRAVRLGQGTALVAGVEQAERGEDEHDRQPGGDEDGGDRARGRGRGLDRQRLGEHVVPLGHAPGHHHRRDRGDGAEPGAAVLTAVEQPQRPDPAHRRQDHQREGPGLEAVEHVVGVGGEHEDASERHDPAGHRRSYGPPP